MATLREGGPYIYPTWLPKLLAGLDSYEWKIWFQVHHDGNSWGKLASDFNLTRYNLDHTELVRRCTEEYEQRGFIVTVERQNQFKLLLEKGTISGKPRHRGLAGRRGRDSRRQGGEPNPSHEIQVMLYMTWLPILDPRFRGAKLSGEVCYGEDAAIDIPAASVDERFREITAGLIGRVTSKTAARKAPSLSECRFCPIGSQYCPERKET